MSWLDDSATDDAPPPDAQVAAPADPYAQPVGPYTQPDPYAQDPYGSSTDPYAQAPVDAHPDPYAQDPYAQPVEPYAQQDPYASSDPYQSFAAAGHDGELTVQPPVLNEVHESANGNGAPRTDLSSLVLDVEVPVEVCFGDAALTVEQFLELGAGSVVELERSIEAPIELRVRGKLVARGQLVTINGNYGLRITETVKQEGTA